MFVSFVAFLVITCVSRPAVPLVVGVFLSRFPLKHLASRCKSVAVLSAFLILPQAESVRRPCLLVVLSVFWIKQATTHPYSRARVGRGQLPHLSDCKIFLRAWLVRSGCAMMWYYVVLIYYTILLILTYWYFIVKKYWQAWKSCAIMLSVRQILVIKEIIRYGIKGFDYHH